MHTDTHQYKRWPRLVKFALRWKLYRPFKIIRGLIRTYLAKSNYTQYVSQRWWDEYYNDVKIDDSHTVEPGKNIYPTLVHYNSTENLILSHFHNHDVQTTGASILDIGSGAGHWIDFYMKLGAKHIDAVEVSQAASVMLKTRFKDNTKIIIHNKLASEVKFDNQFDIINAIGVMFHIVDDSEFESTVRLLTSLLKPGGLLIIGGHFGLFDNINVQFDSNGQINKRLRSRRHWHRLLSNYSEVMFYKNRGYKLINATLPENNILIARK